MARKAMRSSGTRFWILGLRVVLAGSPTPGKTRLRLQPHRGKNRISGIDAEGAWAAMAQHAFCSSPTTPATVRSRTTWSSKNRLDPGEHGAYDIRASGSGA